MSSTKLNYQEVDSLPVEERYKLLWHLLGNLASERTTVSETETPEWHGIVLERIIENHKKNPDNVLTLEEVFAGIRRRRES